MKKTISLLVICLLMLLQNLAQADWIDISPNVQITKTGATLDRIKKVMYSYVKIKNVSNLTLSNDLRLNIVNPSITVVNSDGVSEKSQPYFLIKAPNLSVGQEKIIRVDFQQSRTPLAFSVSMDSDIKTQQLANLQATPGTTSTVYVYQEDSTDLAGLELTVPENALTVSQNITASQLLTNARIPGSTGFSIGSTIKLEPTGLQFDYPVQVTMPYSSDVNPESIVVARKSDNGKIDYILPTFVDKDRQFITFNTDHFTEFQPQYRYEFFGSITNLVDIRNDLSLDVNDKDYTDENLVKALNTTLTDNTGNLATTRIYDLYLHYKQSKDVKSLFKDNKHSEAYDLVFGKDSVNEITAPLEALKTLEDTKITAEITISTFLATTKGRALFTAFTSSLIESFPQAYIGVLIEHAAVKIFETVDNIYIKLQIENYNSDRSKSNNQANTLLDLFLKSFDSGGNSFQDVGISSSSLKYGGYYTGNTDSEVTQYIKDRDSVAIFWNRIEYLYSLNNFDSENEKEILKSLIYQRMIDIHRAANPIKINTLEFKGLSENGDESKRPKLYLDDKETLVSVYEGEEFELVYTIKPIGYTSYIPTEYPVTTPAGMQIAITAFTQINTSNPTVYEWHYRFKINNIGNIDKNDKIIVCYEEKNQESKPVCESKDFRFMKKQFLKVRLDQKGVILSKPSSDINISNNGGLEVTVSPEIFQNNILKINNYPYSCVLLYSGVPRIDDPLKDITGGTGNCGIIPSDQIASASNISVKITPKGKDNGFSLASDIQPIDFNLKENIEKFSLGENFFELKRYISSIDETKVDVLRSTVGEPVHFELTGCVELNCRVTARDVLGNGVFAKFQDTKFDYSFPFKVKGYILFKPTLKLTYYDGRFDKEITLQAKPVWVNQNVTSLIPPTMGNNPYYLSLKSTGNVEAWGSSGTGRAPPTNLQTVRSVAAGYPWLLAAKADGTVVSWHNDQPNMDSIGQAAIPSNLSSVIAVAAGREHYLALKSDGTVSAWGSNDYGETSVPTNLSDVVAISAGWSHSLALKSDGTVVGWGGLGYYGEEIVPPGLSNVVAVAAGANHSMALKSDGTVVAWGGITTTPYLCNVKAIAAAGQHSLALKSDGTVVAWGSDIMGASTVPAGLNNVVAIAAGEVYSLALKSDGTIVAWGWGADQQRVKYQRQ